MAGGFAKHDQTTIGAPMGANAQIISFGYLLEGTLMLRLAIGFLLIALLAGALGLFRTEAVASEVAWVLFVVFLVLAVLSMVVGRRGAPPI